MKSLANKSIIIIVSLVVAFVTVSCADSEPEMFSPVTYEPAKSELHILDGVYRKKLNLKKQMSIGLKKITSIKIGIKFAYKDFLKKNNLKENFK